MMNQVIIVGRLTQDVEVQELEEGKKISNIIVAVPRPFKNEEGIYETDFIPCRIWNAVAQNVSEYCHKGDLLGVKGSIRVEDGNIYINAEKITFLSSEKSEEKENE